MNAIITNNHCPHCHHVQGHYQHVKHTCQTCYGSGQIKCNHYPNWNDNYLYSTSDSSYRSSLDSFSGVSCITSWSTPCFYPCCYHTCPTCNGTGSIWEYEWVNELWSCPVTIITLPCESPKLIIKNDEPKFQQGLGVNKKKKCL